MNSYYKCPSCGNNFFDVITKGVTEIEMMEIEDTGVTTYNNYEVNYEESFIDEFVCRECGESFEFEEEVDFLNYLLAENTLREQKEQIEVEENNEKLKKYIVELQKEIYFLAQELETLKGEILS